MTIYSAKYWGQKFSISADFSQASSPIMTRYEDDDWLCSGFQVADFSHEPFEALKNYIASGNLDDDDDRPLTSDDIDIYDDDIEEEEE